MIANIGRKGNHTCQHVIEIQCIPEKDSRLEFGRRCWANASTIASSTFIVATSLINHRKKKNQQIHEETTVEQTVCLSWKMTSEKTIYKNKIR